MSGNNLGAVLMVAALFALGGAARADIYMYRDGKGVLHFSNAPTGRGYRPFIADNSPVRLAALPTFRGPARLADPARRKRYDSLIREAARRYRVEPALVKAVIQAESDFVPYARSPKGAMGLMQLMPATARMHGVWQILDPRENVEGGVRHLRYLLDRYGGNLRLALAAYNAGVQAVSRHGGVPPYPETTEYLDRVLRFRQMYAREN